MYRERLRVIRAHEKGNNEIQPNIDMLINVLGQFLSSRADLLPEKALAVLASFQDEVPEVPFSHIVSVIEEELGKPIKHIFSMFERKAIAAASLGQVHKAKLASTGEELRLT